MVQAIVVLITAKNNDTSNVVKRLNVLVKSNNDYSILWEMKYENILFLSRYFLFLMIIPIIKVTKKLLWQNMLLNDS